jgi:hypothetical protein
MNDLLVIMSFHHNVDPQVVLLLLEIEPPAVAPIHGCRLQHAAAVLGVDALASHCGQTDYLPDPHPPCSDPLASILLAQHSRDSVEQGVNLLLSVAVQVDVERVLPQHLLHLLYP